VTLLEVLRRATAYLQRREVSSPRLDAELLLAHGLGVRRIDLYLQFERPLQAAELASCRDLIARRARGSPVAYLVGRKEFMTLDIAVTPEVLIPNPDTETLVELAIAWGRARDSSLVVADVGTGSGCIALALASYLPQAEVWATDDSPAALAVAESNVRAHGLEERIHLRHADLLDGLGGRFDLICANLPYVPEGTKLPAEVMAQPAHALFAPQMGTALIRRLLEAAPGRLAPGGRVMVELGPDLEPAIDLTGYQDHRFHRDLAGLVRVLEVWAPVRGDD
jgi:release factor glutamine methyltransferase